MESERLITIAAATAVASINLFIAVGSATKATNAARLDDTAQKRFASSCVFPHDPKTLQQIPVKAAQWPVDETGQPIPPGTPICDRALQTAILGDDGKGTDFAEIQDTQKYHQLKADRSNALPNENTMRRKNDKE